MLGENPSAISRSPSFNFDEVLAQAPFVTDLDAFLKEKNPAKALKFWLGQFAGAAPLTSTDDIRQRIQLTISQIDQQINHQVNRIIHHPRLQKLEAAWRGVWYLAVQADGIKNVKVKLLDASWLEISKDIARAMEFDQSALFNKIYSEEYGTPGGEPYGALIGDYEISHKLSARHRQDDLATLDGIAQIAAAAFAPFIAGASCEFFGLDDFSTLRLPLNLTSLFAQEEYIRWRALRGKAESRFVGLTLPRILMRRPYRTTPGSHKGLFFYELLDGTDKNYCWGNAAYAFGGILIREFASVGWFGHIRGVPRNQMGGGLVTNLPCDVFATDPNDIITKPSTDVVITDSIERDISNMGFIPLCQCFATPWLAFYSNQSIQLSKRQGSRDAQVNAKLSTMLQHVLCASRVAHYIKVMVRDKIGSFITADQCEDYLRTWLHQYTTGREDLEWEEQARYPLHASNVRVREHPEKPGSYLCVIHLVPCYQTDQMVSELELVTELVQSSA